jgi:hypothetical protein
MANGSGYLLVVIPEAERSEAVRNPGTQAEPVLGGPVFLDSGLAASRRPGMTILSIRYSLLTIR